MLAMNRDEIREKLNSIGLIKAKELLRATNNPSRTIDSKAEYFHPDATHIVETWIEEQETIQAEKTKKAELNLANEANKISKDANRVSWFSAAIAALSLILSIMALTK